MSPPLPCEMVVKPGMCDAASLRFGPEGEHPMAVVEDAAISGLLGDGGIGRFLDHRQRLRARRRTKRWRAQMGGLSLVRSAVAFCMEAGYPNKLVAFAWAILHPSNAAIVGRAYYLSKMADSVIQRHASQGLKVKAIEVIALIAVKRDGEAVARTVLLLLMVRYSLPFSELGAKTLELIGWCDPLMRGRPSPQP